MPSENVRSESPTAITHAVPSLTETKAETQAAETQAAEEPTTAEPTVQPFFTQRLGRPGFRKPIKPPIKPLWPAIVLAMLAIASFVGWRAFKILTTSPVADSETSTAQALLPVSVAEAEVGLIQRWAFDQGTIWPVQRRILNFQANGDITYVAKVGDTELKEGDFVSKGELLATIDSRRQVSGIETAEADVDVSQNQRNQSEAALLQAQANVEKAGSDLALAQSELQRYQTLFQQGAVAESDRDVYQNRVDQATAAFQTAQQDVRAAVASIRSAESTLGASRSRLSQTAVDLEDTQLVSPIDGIVAYINIREGEYWNTQYFNRSDAQTAIETAPIVVMDPQSFEVELEIQSGEAANIRPGQRAYVVLEQDVSAAQAAGATSQNLLAIAQQRGSEGRVFAVSPSQTPGGRGTEVTIRDLQQVRNLKVGGRAYVWIEVAAKSDAVMVPLGALQPRNQEFYAFVVNEVNGTVHRRRVSRGIEGLSEVEIVAGVKPGELVVTEGQNRLVENTPVEIINRDRRTSTNTSEPFIQAEPSP